MSLPSTLAALEASGLIRVAQLQPELEYLFRHALVQEAAYGSLVRSDRRVLHRSVGERLEGLYPGRIEELAPLLARHFHEGGDEGRALHYFTLAGDDAFRMYAIPEAISHYGAALDLAKRAAPGMAGPPPAPQPSTGDLSTSPPAPPSVTLRHLWSRLGRAQELNGQYDAALQTYAEMLDLARQWSDVRLELDVLLSQATVYAAPTARVETARANALLEHALRLSRELGDRAAEARVLWNLLLANHFSGQARMASEYGEASLRLAQELGLQDQVAQTTHDLWYSYVTTGRAPEALTTLQRARKFWEEMGNLPMLQDSLGSQTYASVLMGEYENALALSSEANRISQAIGNLWGQAYSRQMVWIVHAERGEYGQALDVAEECIRLAEQAGFVVPQTETRAGIGWLYGQMGEVSKGIEIAAQALEAADRLIPDYRVISISTLALLHHQAGNVSAAEQWLGEAESLLKSTHGHVYALGTLHLARILGSLSQGRYGEAIERAVRMIAYLRDNFFRLFLCDGLYLKGKALSAAGRTGEAREALEQARVEAETVGSRRCLWRILATLAEVESASGNPDEAERLRGEAREIVEYIAGHMGSSELRASFVGLAEVRKLTEGLSSS